MNNAQKAEREAAVGQLRALKVDASRLNWAERRSIKWALDYIDTLEREQSWKNPYSKAIAVLEAQSRAFEGSYG